MPDLVHVDVAAHQVYQGDRLIHLSPFQFDILAALVANAGKVVTHEHLMQAMWGCSQAKQVGIVRVQMQRVREALGDDANSPTYIHSATGVGYRFTRELAGRGYQPTVDIDGVSYEVLHWDRQPDHDDRTRVFTLYARPLEAVADA